MVWVKSQIWSPDQLKEIGGFQLFQQDTTLSTGGVASFSVVKETKEVQHRGEFPDYAELLLQDPQVRGRLEEWVEEKLSTEFRKFLGELQQVEGLNDLTDELDSDQNPRELLEKAKKNLITKFQNHHQQLKQQLSVWTQMNQDLKNDRDKLLRSHERAWCEAMTHLLRQFQIANSTGIIAAIEEWMTLAVPEFLEKSSVTVHLSKKDFEAVKGSQQEIQGKHWGLQADSDLLPGQIRIESENAGVIFDSIQGFEKLNRFLECES